MIYLTALVGFLLVLTAEAKVGKCSELTFSADTEECLLYDLVCKTEYYEVRYYDSIKWVSTHEKSCWMDFAVPPAFKRLYGYISGENEDGRKIDMTAPVSVNVTGELLEYSTYTISFLLPAEYQENPPAPTDSCVFISEMKGVFVYVLSYGGWMMSLSDMYEAQCLANALDSDHVLYNHGFHFAASYNSPMTLFKRHNEVWYIADGEPVCH